MRYEEEVLRCEGDEALQQVALSSWKCSKPSWMEL